LALINRGIHRAIHSDPGVDYELAWDLATERLPELADELSMLVADR
jgi:uncharacterized protein with HEPN domain